MIQEGSESGTLADNLSITVYKMDIERIRYSLARYLRTRILKIERNLYHIVNNEESLANLSLAEQEFATKLYSQMQAFCHDAVHSRVVGDEL